MKCKNGRNDDPHLAGKLRIEDGAVVMEGGRDDTNPNAPSIPILMPTY